VPRRAIGSVVEDVDGNLFLDCNAGIAVTSTGHCHPRVVSAVTAQAAELLHYSASDFYLPIYSQMCAALAATAPIPGPVRVFLTNSGAEAVEGALKLARYATGRPYVISFFGAFHGRSYGAMTLTASKAKYHQGFGPLVPGVLHAPYAFNRVDPVSRRAVARRRGDVFLSGRRAVQVPGGAVGGRGDLRRAGTGRGRVHRAARRLARAAALAVRQARDPAGRPTRCSPGWAVPGGCGPSSTRACSLTC